MKPRFVIFAHARSGSSSLAHLLNASPDYINTIDSPAAMNAALDEIFSEYSAIKDLMYRFERPVYEALLSRPDLKVLFLHREDLVAGAISLQVAKQTAVWQKHDLDADPAQYTRTLEPIDIEEAQGWYEYVSEMVRHYQQFLEQHRRGEFMNISYESLYNDDDKRNTSKLTDICEFLQIELPPAAAIAKYMNPKSARLSSDELYSRIPNYQEVLDYFSNTQQ